MARRPTRPLSPIRPLSPEEAALWAKVTSTIRPLHGTVALREPEPEPTPPPATRRAVAASPRPKPATPAPRVTIGRTLDATWDKKLLTGAVDPDRTVDLHGMNLDGAWQAIDDALERAIARGERVVLLITGHHRPGEPPVARGKIRAAVHDWLAASRHARAIAAVRGAHRRHGGAGSLYLVLRRR